MLRIVFICHDSSIAGAQLLLFRYVQWIQDNFSNYKLSVVLLNNGPMVDKFNGLCETFCVFSKKSGLIDILFGRSILKDALFSIENADIVYSSTIMNGWFFRENKILHHNLVVHVHEMESWIAKNDPLDLQYLFDISNRYIFPSHSVLNTVAKYKDLSGCDYAVIPEYFNISESIRSKSLHDRLNIHLNNKIIGGCGVEFYRKGVDYFMEIAQKYLHEYPDDNIHFVWFGIDSEDLFKGGYHFNSLHEKIHFLPRESNVSEYFSDLFIFCMTSREDPFPVVNLEAGIRSVPVLSFDCSGGSSELLSMFPECLIMGFDTSEFVKRIRYFILNEEFRNKIAYDFKEIILNRYSDSVVCPIIHEYVNKYNC